MILDTVGDVVATSYASLFQVPLVAHTGQGILYDQYGVSAVHGFVAFDVYTGLTPAGEVDSGYALGDSIVSIGSPGLAFGRSGLHFAYMGRDNHLGRSCCLTKECYSVLGCRSSFSSLSLGQRAMGRAGLAGRSA